MTTKEEQARRWLGFIYNCRGMGLDPERNPEAWRAFAEWCEANGCEDNLHAPGVDTKFVRADGTFDTYAYLVHHITREKPDEYRF